MATAFSRSLRTVSADSAASTITLTALAGVFLCAWGVWISKGRVTLFEVTEQARIEVASAAAPLQSPLAGRVVNSSLAMGRTVDAGDILVTLDAAPQKLEIGEQSARMAGLSAELTAVRAQIAAEDKARTEERQAATVAMEQAVAQQREAAAPAQFSKEEMRRLSELKRLGLIAERDYARGKAEAERQTATVDSSRIAVRKIEQEQRTRDSERDARVERLRAEMVRIEGQMQALRASMERLSYEVERRVIRAPISGKLGEAKVLRAGAVIAEGERLAAIIPDGRLRVVANFPPPAAMGRVRAGQTARMRMHGFPWAQYGVVEASVTRVADEIRDGAVRVELSVKNAGDLRMPLQHGMPGSLEVEVDKLSPAALMLRLAGQWVTEPRENHMVARGNGELQAQP